MVVRATKFHLRPNTGNSRNYVADAPRQYYPGRGGRHDPFAIGRTGLSSAYLARPARILRTSVLGEIPIASAAALLLG